MDQSQQQIKVVAYKVMFSTVLSQEEIEQHIDDFLRNVDARQTIAYVEELSEQDRIALCQNIVKNQ